MSDGRYLEQYVIYDRPRDFPVGFVVRRWEVHGAEDIRPCEAWRAATLDEARELVPPTLVSIGRFADDDPAIVEVWT